MKCETTLKYLFTVMENVAQFSRSIENSVFNLFFNFFSMIIFLFLDSQ